MSPVKNSTASIHKACESDHGLDSHHGSMDASRVVERRHSVVDTPHDISETRTCGAVMSADRPQHTAVSRPGRDGIRLSDSSRMVSLLKKQDVVTSDVRIDVQGLTSPHSYVDKFSEFLSHGK